MWIIEPEEECSGGITPSGIGYKRIVPAIYDSALLYDVGWHHQNGGYDYSSDPVNPEYTQELDFDTYGYGAYSGHYKLKHNNAFGNKYRFTTSNGDPATDGCLRFYGSSQFVGALDGYIIDHLTGEAYDVRNGIYSGTLSSNLNAIKASTQHGFNDWKPMSIEHLYSVMTRANLCYSNSMGASGIFCYTLSGGALPLFWGVGEAARNSTTNGYRFRASTSALEVVAFSTSMAMFACRKHY